ncbi:MAG TPA: hypothetical protein VIY53_07185 [Acidobacteriaceae bacterium]
MKTMIETARWMCIAVGVAMAAQVSAQTWTAPVVLSTGGQGWEAGAAIDGDGNSLAVWEEITTQSQLWSRAKANGANWGSVTEVSPALQTTSVFPAVRVTTAGFATAVWSDSNGVWTADRPSGSKWDAAQLVIPGSANPIFVMNSRGDAAIAWSVGGGPRSTSGSVMAVLRPAGGEWSAQETVASGAHLIVDHAGIGDSGEVIVTWETYTAVCQRYGCSQTNYLLHASRQNTGSGAWADSGSLQGPDLTAHDARVELDSAGGAILLAHSSSGVYTSATQGNSGGAWSAFKAAVNPQGSVIIADLAGDDAGQVTLVYECITYPTSQALAVNGAIANNAWSSPVVLSGVDTSVGQVYFAQAPNGASLATWLSSSGTPAVHAVTRASATGTWSAPASISGPLSYISPEAAAVEPNGNGMVIYSGYNAASVHTEYAINYLP